MLTNWWAPVVNTEEKGVWFNRALPPFDAAGEEVFLPRQRCKGRSFFVRGYNSMAKSLGLDVPERLFSSGTLVHEHHKVIAQVLTIIPIISLMLARIFGISPPPHIW